MNARKRKGERQYNMTEWRLFLFVILFANVVDVVAAAEQNTRNQIERNIHSILWHRVGIFCMHVCVYFLSWLRGILVGCFTTS